MSNEQVTPAILVAGTSESKPKTPKLPRKSIHKSVKNNVWLQHYGEKFSVQCSVEWCATIINPFTFEVGHNHPHSKGGSIDIENLKPICACCNKSMGNRFTIDEYSKLFKPRKGKTRPNKKDIANAAKHAENKGGSCVIL